MRVTFYFIAIAFFTQLLSCDFSRIDNKATDFYHKELLKLYSPDNTKYFTINENGTDSSNAHTQVLLNFKNGGAGIYAIQGINKNINAYWKGNSLIVIETFKEYKADQKWPKVQFLDDIVQIEYIEK